MLLGDSAHCCSEDVGGPVLDTDAVGGLLQVQRQRVVVHLQRPDLLLALHQGHPQLLHLGVLVPPLLQLCVLDLHSPAEGREGALRY